MHSKSECHAACAAWRMLWKYRVTVWEQDPITLLQERNTHPDEGEKETSGHITASAAALMCY